MQQNNAEINFEFVQKISMIMNHYLIIVEQVNLLINDVYLETIFPKNE
jgi:hypothetical protein